MRKKKIDITPKNFDEMICKDIIFKADSIITKMIENNDLFSILFFGEPGVGKSLSINLILKKINKPHYYFNSTVHNKQDLDKFLSNINQDEKPIIVIEEIHRLNKDKQDLLLMYLERKMIVVLATTTENPFFKVNPALRSRMFLYKIEKIEKEILLVELKKFLSLRNINISNRVLETIVEVSKSDFRTINFLIEIVIKYYSDYEETKIIDEIVKTSTSRLDRKGTNNYDVLSAFHKSIRGSDPDASLYYLVQLLENGDMNSIYRRLYAVVYEDIGLANSSLGPKVHAAIQASEFLGMPEARIPLSNIVVELCLSPKSNSTMKAIDEAFQFTSKNNYEPPLHLRDNHYKSAIKLGVKNYLFPHNYKNSYVKQEYMPKETMNKKFYKYNEDSINELKMKKYWDGIKK